MKAILRLTRLALPLAMGALLFAVAGTSVAQGPPGQDPYNPPPGHGGVPPGQAKKQGYGGMPPGQAKKEGYGKVPPGQAKKQDFRFQNDDRQRFYSHYRSDADHWKGHKRSTFARGEVIPHSYSMRPLPHSYWAGGPPPPPGYQYGYYQGYVVAYDPTTRVIADVLDLVGTAMSH